MVCVTPAVAADDGEIFPISTQLPSTRPCTTNRLAAAEFAPLYQKETDDTDEGYVAVVSETQSAANLNEGDALP